MTEKTEKLYYKSSYIKEFKALVISCAKEKESYLIALDQTAFYPEGGGQPSDTGILGDVKITYVYEKDGIIYHVGENALNPGDTVTGKINWENRFSLMQNHTGEHIVSGIVNRLFKLNNTGFHMGSDFIIIDFDGELSEQDTDQVEILANEAVYRNIPVKENFFSQDEIKNITYRSKKALTGDIRLVSVEDTDLCACCGTHVDKSGEIGIIKLISSQRYKGGSRISMLCGRRALLDYSNKNKDIYALSAMLSAKVNEIPSALKKAQNESESLIEKIDLLKTQIFNLKVEKINTGINHACIFENELNADEIRRFCIILAGRVKIAAVFSGSDEKGYKYAFSSNTVDISGLGKEINIVFKGRGGGNKSLIQGSLLGLRELIEKFLQEKIEEYL